LSNKDKGSYQLPPIYDKLFSVQHLAATGVVLRKATAGCQNVNILVNKGYILINS